MITVIIIICVIVWYTIGIISFIYWWTVDYDLTTDELPICCMAGIIGPIAFISGWFIHGSLPHSPKVLKKKRNSWISKNEKWTYNKQRL